MKMKTLRSALREQSHSDALYMQMRDITELSLGIFLDREIRHYLRDILKVYRFISASVAMRPRVLFAMRKCRFQSRRLARLYHGENCHYFYSDGRVFHILMITSPLLAVTTVDRDLLPSKRQSTRLERCTVSECT